MMGSPPGEPKRSNEEYQHRVVISRPFYIQATEVTEAQYFKMMGRGSTQSLGLDRCPAFGVTWFEAQEFVRRLNAREKTNKYRLATEAEWEYACRAGSRTTYCFGNDPNGLWDYAWYADNAELQMQPVGQKLPNRWGVHDIHGNVWEWCQDWYGKDYYRHSPTRDPRGPSSGTTRVLRGGSWNNYATDLRSANRFWGNPSGNAWGFRVVRDY